MFGSIQISYKFFAVLICQPSNTAGPSSAAQEIDIFGSLEENY